jgi:hypothetical protein
LRDLTHSFTETFVNNWPWLAVSRRRIGPLIFAAMRKKCRIPGKNDESPGRAARVAS